MHIVVAPSPRPAQAWEARGRTHLQQRENGRRFVSAISVDERQTGAAHGGPDGLDGVVKTVFHDELDELTDASSVEGLPSR